MSTGKNAVVSAASPSASVGSAGPSRLRLGAALASAEPEASWRSWRPSKRLVWIAAGVVALGALAGGAFKLRRSAAVPAPQVAQATVADLQHKVAKAPRDAVLHASLGHAYFQAGAHGRAVAEYQTALRLDPRVGDDGMTSDLIAAFATPQQTAAANLIGEYKLVQATDGLEKLTDDHRYGVRLSALTALERLGRASRMDHQRVWIHDLDTPDCSVKRHAISRLGDLGDARALEPLLAAKKKDDDATPWYRFRCISSRADDAEKRILSRQEPQHLARR